MVSILDIVLLGFCALSIYTVLTFKIALIRNNVLNQDIAENLTHSGLMENFERPSSRILTATTKKRSEWTEANNCHLYTSDAADE